MGTSLPGSIVIICTLILKLEMSEVSSQPVIDESFLYNEYCSRQDHVTTNQKLRQTIDLIMEELQLQSHENMLLKDEVVELRVKYTEQKILLSQLTATVELLAQKLRQGAKTCGCPSPHPQSTENTRLENTTTTPNTLSTTGSLHSTIARVETSPTVTAGQVEAPSFTESTVTDTTSARVKVQVYPRDCQDLPTSDLIYSRTYKILPLNASEPFLVYCQVENGTAWTVIQTRDGGMVDFYRNWVEYKEGFGDPNGEYWIGNEHLHRLTMQATYKLRIDMWDWTGAFYYAESNYIYVDNETRFYKLHTPDDYYSYRGFGGSGLRVHRGPFMTYDKQDPSLISNNCAKKFHSGWWFTTCVRNANLNGKYYHGGYFDTAKKRRSVDDIYWHNINQSLKKVVMRLLRTKDEPPKGLV